MNKYEFYDRVITNFYLTVFIISLLIFMYSVATYDICNNSNKELQEEAPTEFYQSIGLQNF